MISCLQNLENPGSKSFIQVVHIFNDKHNHVYKDSLPKLCEKQEACFSEQYKMGFDVGRKVSDLSLSKPSGTFDSTTISLEVKILFLRLS